MSWLKLLVCAATAAGALFGIDAIFGWSRPDPVNMIGGAIFGLAAGVVWLAWSERDFT